MSSSALMPVSGVAKPERVMHGVGYQGLGRVRRVSPWRTGLAQAVRG